MAGRFLTKAEVEALEEALDDEYRAWATRDRVIRDFGPVRPLVNVRDAEAGHIEALETLFGRSGLTVPENPWTGRVKPSGSLLSAGEDAVADEIGNAALHERLVHAVRHADVRRLFLNLESASQQRHFPTFRCCAARGDRHGGGPRRRGGGAGGPCSA
ncbi:MAG: hypothetical protein V2I63_06445 [Pseudomonadales bacterium]|jgi:hypothetical protein|nr:hypothetical protein [Pseudomonadales bacterium]